MDDKQKEIEIVLAQLQLALKESFDAAQAEEQAKLRKIAAHHALLLAKQALFALTQELS
jgi:hypothetical protein